MLYESFLARYKEANARESLEMPEARIVTKAEAPIRPSFPKSSLFLALALLLGLSLGSVIALGVEYFDKRIKTLEQAKAISGLAGIAALPQVGPRELARLAKRGGAELGRYNPASARLLPLTLQPPLLHYALEAPTSMFAEAVRSIRLAEFAADPQHAFPGEGQMKPEQLEIERLRREVIKLKAERDILKKAAAYFAKDSI